MRVDLTWLDDLLDFDDGDARSFGEARIEVLSAAFEFAVAQAVGAIGRHEGIVDLDRWLEDEGLAVKETQLFVAGDGCTNASWRVDAGEPSAAGAQALDQRALRDDLEFDRSRRGLLAGRRVDIGPGDERDNQPRNLVVLDQLGRRTADAICHQTQVFGALLRCGGQQTVGYARGKTKARNRDRCAIGQVRDGRGRRGKNFVHPSRWTIPEAAGCREPLRWR